MTARDFKVDGVVWFSKKRLQISTAFSLQIPEMIPVAFLSVQSLQAHFRKFVKNASYWNCTIPSFTDAVRNSSKYAELDYVSEGCMSVSS